MSRSASCPQCGAQVELPPERVADTCSFCETPLVVKDLGESETFDLVVPFDVPRDRASKVLRSFMASDRWAPEHLRHAARPEALHGVLVPFYVYDGVARSAYSARIGIYWYRTETYVVIVNGRPRTRTRRVRETEWHSTSGEHAANYVRQLASGSRGIPEAEANALEPFDLGRAMPYAPALTAGWIAERPNVTHEQASQTVAKEVAARENAAIKQFVPGDLVQDVQNQTQLSIGKVELAMLPVWIATYTHEGTVFRLLVNGQTGEVVGKLPRSKVKMLIAALIVFALVMMVLAFVTGAFGIAALIGGSR